MTLKGVANGKPSPPPEAWPRALDDPFSMRPRVSPGRFPRGADGRDLPWDRMRSIYGRATRVIPHLEALLDVDRHGEHAEALELVMREIEHQGTLCQCTANVVGLIRSFPLAQGCCQQPVEGALAHIREVAESFGAKVTVMDPLDPGRLMPEYRSDRLEQSLWEGSALAPGELERWHAAALAVLQG